MARPNQVAPAPTQPMADKANRTGSRKPLCIVLTLLAIGTILAGVLLPLYFLEITPFDKDGTAPSGRFCERVRAVPKTEPFQRGESARAHNDRAKKIALYYVVEKLVKPARLQPSTRNRLHTSHDSHPSRVSAFTSVTKVTGT